MIGYVAVDNVLSTAFCCLYFIYVIGIVSEKAEGYVYGTYCYLCFYFLNDDIREENISPHRR
uniref:Uncharacterized protein n=1 Tax=Enterococcus faecalis TaxID=1351 RepID=A0A4Y6I0M9_ENTFL|nr:hypothetical protein [Enterococcus faecalis]